MTLTDHQESEVCEMLDELITINRDDVERFKLAVDALDSEQYKQLFWKNIGERERFIIELAQLMDSYGGVWTDSQSVSGTIQNTWMSILNALTSGDGAILAECDRSGQATIEAYHETILKELPYDVETCLRRQFFLLKGTQERIHRLSGALK